MAYITLNKNNFFNNLDIITQQTKSKNKIALVLKDNAYGHGILEVASMAKEYGIKKAVVRCEVEACMVEDMFEYILVLNDYPSKPTKHIRYTINDINSIKKFPKGCVVELKVDTGMQRNGISFSQIKEALKLIDECGLVLDGVFTHHRCADELSSEWFWQNERFKSVKELVKTLGYSVKFHSANSASLFRYEDFDEDMARVGIAVYGCMELPKVFDKTNSLKPVLSLYANKISSRKVLANTKIGYGSTYEFEKDCVVSNYDFGYGDGFLRGCSNNYTTPKNKKLVGRISMDNSSFVAEEDELLIFDDAREVAKKANTISYEVLTSLKHYMKRVVV